MCIIAIKPAGKKMFDDTTLKTMFINNPDGAGYMYYDKRSKKVVCKKGFMAYSSLKKSLDSLGDVTGTNLVLHFRITTSGLSDGLNCHPFPINQKNATSYKADIAMAHNGIMPAQFIPAKNSKINDTQVFINEIINKLNKKFLYDDGVKNLIKSLIGSNKLAFLDSKNNVTLIGDFVKDKGYIFSNHSYQVQSLYPVGYRYTHSSVYKSNGYSGSVCTTYKHSKADSKGKTKDAQNSGFNVTPMSDDELEMYYSDADRFWADWDARHPYAY